MLYGGAKCRGSLLRIFLQCRGNVYNGYRTTGGTRQNREAVGKSSLVSTNTPPPESQPQAKSLRDGFFQNWQAVVAASLAAIILPLIAALYGSLASGISDLKKDISELAQKEHEDSANLSKTEHDDSSRLADALRQGGTTTTDVSAAMRGGDVIPTLRMHTGQLNQIQTTLRALQGDQKDIRDEQQEILRRLQRRPGGG